MEIATTVADRVTLNDGRSMPQLGYGVFQVPDADAATLVQDALSAGYRSIDTASLYDNERGVGEGIRRSGLDRDEVFVTTKLWNTEHGRDAPRIALERSLSLLGMDDVDLYLIHWPAPVYGLHVETWHALVELRDAGLARSIGVSNFSEHQLEEIIAASGVTPVLNQVELHPWLPQSELRTAHDRLDILTQAWSPLGRGGELLSEPALVAIADELDATPAQVVLRWHLELGNVVIPKSATPSRIVENADIFGWELSEEHHAQIAELARPDGRIGPDPQTATW